MGIDRNLNMLLLISRKTDSNKQFLRSSDTVLLCHKLLNFSRGEILLLHMAAFLEARNCAKAGLRINCSLWGFCHSPSSWAKFWQPAKQVTEYPEVKPTQLSKQQALQQMTLQQNNPTTAQAYLVEESKHTRAWTNFLNVFKSATDPWQTNFTGDLVLPPPPCAVTVIRCAVAVRRNTLNAHTCDDVKTSYANAKLMQK